MERYSLIKAKMPREFVLLQGRGCFWRQCTFCDYHEDVSPDPYEINRGVLESITGECGVLDVINSGSAMELDERTLSHLKRVVREKNIHTLWFEAHWLYRDRLTEFAEGFAPTVVKFRCGVESFDGELRKAWKKGIASNVTPERIADYFKGVCLLVGVEGQKREQILSDIALARRYFDYFSVNLFCPNTTAVRRDEELAQWFVEEVAPLLLDEPKAECLIANTDLGVG
ncbi:MAG: hypothetical protein J6U53_02980 [Tidjanibacter sp.]|nr:hypothetical protein [Tidjanibacter sp.]